MRRFLMAALVGGLALMGGSRAFAQAQPTMETLNNGLRVAVVEDHRSPRVAINLCFTVGGMDEVGTKIGLAHAFEHIWFKSSQAVRDMGGYSSIISKLGGSNNAHTQMDRTCYTASIGTTGLEKVLWLYGETWKHLKLDDAMFQLERGAIIQERRMRLDNTSSGAFQEALSALFYGNHPYGRSLIGSMDEINGWVLSDLTAWFASHYAPSNAVLTLAGDVTQAEATAIAQRQFGDIADYAVVHSNDHIVEPAPTEAKVLPTMSHPQQRYAQMVRYYRAPGAFTAVGRTDGGSIATATALDAAAGMLDEYLYITLAMEKHLTVSVGAGYSGDKRYEGSFQVWAVPAPGVPPEMVENAINEAITAWLNGDGLTIEKLELYTMGVKTRVTFGEDSVSNVAGYVGDWLSIGGTPANINQWVAEMDTLTLDKVKAAAHDVLQLKNSTTGWLLPAQAQ